VGNNCLVLYVNSDITLLLGIEQHKTGALGLKLFANKSTTIMINTKGASDKSCLLNPSVSRGSNENKDAIRPVGKGGKRVIIKISISLI
jgi:hypothetical protein